MSDSESALVIGVDIGGSKTIVGLVTRAGEILRMFHVVTPSSPAKILVAVEQLCQTLISESEREVIAIGIGSAGTIDSSSGRVIHANENLPGWTGTKLSALAIGDNLPVFAENDARALSYGEVVLGAGVAYSSVMCITVGTGIGGGIIIDGKIWHGASYGAGEIGYLVVDWDGDEPLILDQFSSGPGIERAYQAACGGTEAIALTEISRRAKAGDVCAADIIKHKAKQFGVIVGGIVASINPEALVIGGGVPQIGPLWWDAFEKGFRGTVPVPLQATPILPATLGVEAVLLGAAMLAWHQVDA